MKRKKITYVLVIILVLVFVPKTVDWLFSQYFCDLTALDYIGASDVLGYIGSIIGGVCSLIAVIVAIQQFSVEKTPIIVPQNKVTYFYLDAAPPYRFRDSVNIGDRPDMDMPIKPSGFILENISSCAAVAFDIEINYQKGTWYRQICDLIGGEPTQMVRCGFENNVYPEQGVFNANSTRLLAMPVEVESIISGICYRLREADGAFGELGKRWNYFLRKKYKIAEIKIHSQDVLGKQQTNTYDMKIEITDYIDKPIYEIIFTFVAQPK